MWDRYSLRLNLKGESERERRIARIKDDITGKIEENPSYKPDAVVTDSYGTERQTGLIINRSTQEYYKEFEALPDTTIYAGDYVEWGRGIWLVQSCSTDDEIYKRGILWQCNWELKWQNDDGDVISRWCFVSSASKYNEGVEQDKVFTLGSDQCKVYLPIDEEVLAVTKKKEMLFIIDNADDGQPRIYEAHNPSNVYSTFDVLKEDDGYLHGVTDWILKETTYTLSDEEAELGYCYNPSVSSDDDDEDEDTTIISGASELPLSKAKTYTVDSDSWADTYSWQVVCDFTVTLATEDNSASIRCDDSDAIGSYLSINIIDSDSDETIATKSVLIKGLYG